MDFAGFSLRNSIHKPKSGASRDIYTAECHRNIKVLAAASKDYAMGSSSQRQLAK